MRTPLVTVICLSYNHGKFIKEAVESVIHQTYRNVQIIAVDDASSDNSQLIIRELKMQHEAIDILLLDRNLGNCTAFNKALVLARGEFIIDFAADDVMAPDKIEKQVNYFEKLDKDVGIVFTDANYINESGTFIRSHFDHLRRKRLINTIPHGDVYQKVLTTYFIPSPTCMIRHEVLQQLGGYDEKLSYEDFDLFVRASRYFRFEYLNERSMNIRKLSGSMSKRWYAPGDKQLMSTYLVCLKALDLNRGEKDRAALITRVHYELRQSVITGNRKEAGLFFNLLHKLGAAGWEDKMLMFVNIFHFPLRGLRTAYHRLRFGED